MRQEALRWHLTKSVDASTSGKVGMAARIGSAPPSEVLRHSENCIDILLGRNRVLGCGPTDGCTLCVQVKFRTTARTITQSLESLSSSKNMSRPSAKPTCLTGSSAVRACNESKVKNNIFTLVPRAQKVTRPTSEHADKHGPSPQPKLAARRKQEEAGRRGGHSAMVATTPGEGHGSETGTRRHLSIDTLVGITAAREGQAEAHGHAPKQDPEMRQSQLRQRPAPQRARERIFLRVPSLDDQPQDHLRDMNRPGAPTSASPNSRQPGRDAHEASGQWGSVVADDQSALSVQQCMASPQAQTASFSPRNASLRESAEAKASSRQNEKSLVALSPRLPPLPHIPTRLLTALSLSLQPLRHLSLTSTSRYDACALTPTHICAGHLPKGSEPDAGAAAAGAHHQDPCRTANTRHHPRSQSTCRG